MSHILRLPPQTQPPTENMDLRHKRNALREPLRLLALKLRSFPDPDCYKIDYALGFSANQLKNHIESKFEQGMTWENSDTWNLEHIIPIHHYIQWGTTDARTVNALKNIKPVFSTKKTDLSHNSDEREYTRVYMRRYKELKQKQDAQATKKQCLICGEEKDIKEFRALTKARDSYGITCNTCLKKRKRERIAMSLKKCP